MLTDPDDGRAPCARLFPVVHPDDPTQEAEYQRLMRDELVTSRLAGIDTVVSRARRPGRKVAARRGRDVAFMQAINSVRLVLGTMLDVTEDDELDRPRSSSRPPSTSCTATCPGCSTSSVRAMSGDRL